MGEEELVDGWWSADVELSRTPSPGIPTKRLKMTLEDISQDFRETTMQKDSDFGNLLRIERGPESLGYGNTPSFRELWFSSANSSSNLSMDSGSENYFQAQEKPQRKKMRTGCIPCLYVARGMRNVDINSDL